MTTIHRYLLVQVTQDVPEGEEPTPRDLDAFTVGAMRQTVLYRPDFRVEAHEVEPPRPDDRVSVDDFVSVEPTDDGAFLVLVWTADGHSAIVHHDRDQGSCERRADKIRETLRTWDGWK